MNIYNGNLDEISTEQVILTGRNIYRKLSNINESYDLYMLAHLDTHFVWSKVYENLTLNGSEILNMDRFSYTIENTFNNVTKELISFLTIYKADEKETLTQTTIFNGSYDIPFYWNDLSSELNIRLLNKYTISKSLKDLPTHIDLTRECSDDDNECPNDEYDPLQGWNNIAINDVINDWCTLDDEEKKKEEEEEEEGANDSIQGEEDIQSDDEEDIHLEDKYEEERVDPFNGKWYTESEFIDYYGGRVEWSHQEPKKILLREEYFKFTNMYSYLDTDKFIFLFKKYEKTFC
jgi:hypothetical protein